MNQDNNLLRDEAKLHAFVDGRLAPDERAQVQARLDADPEAARTVRAWQEQKAMLQALYGEVADEPVPVPLLHAAQQLHHRSSRVNRWARWGGMAAALLLAFGLGWGGNMQWQSWHDGMGFGIARGRGPAEFARQAQMAFTVYSPEVRHPVEVEAAQQQHLVQWLSKRLNRPLKVPNLTEQGYELVGGRLLPGDQGARAQFMYQNARGERITLYVGAIDPKAGSNGETAFRFTSEGGVNSFYWVDQGFGYALTGKAPKSGMLVLAENVYKQL
ncbi:anti-sigma factor [Ramlibacter sp. G-1-2-2]|uniref:Anti-sigma factor n=1 Tax=Ramlibacter agri TaxID=2728837 RepID=A0A848HFM1_9BURK|nr:anti-sigma factor [Ramlibacter agri]NML48239.1 anti-sigma factor [Ramlibacter agri]